MQQKIHLDPTVPPYHSVKEKHHYLLMLPETLGSSTADDVGGYFFEKGTHYNSDVPES